jgi:hypothetical protein
MLNWETIITILMGYLYIIPGFFFCSFLHGEKILSNEDNSKYDTCVIFLYPLILVRGYKNTKQTIRWISFINREIVEKINEYFETAQGYLEAAKALSKDSFRKIRNAYDSNLRSIYTNWK